MEHAGEGGLRFEAAPAPTLEELEETLKYIYARVVKWLGRHGLLRDVEGSNEAPTYSAGEALTLAGMQRGTLETAKESGEPAEPELSGALPRVRDAAVHERFNLHASVHLAAHDDLGTRPRPALVALRRWCRRRAPGFFGCTECLGRAMHGERGWYLTHLNRMQGARNRRARRRRCAGWMPLRASPRSARACLVGLVAGCSS